MTAEYTLEILPEVLRLIRNPKNWSKDCTATKAGEMCPPWDLHADAWSLFGAIEKVLIDKDQYGHLLLIANELVIDAKENILTFNHISTHETVIELLFTTMNRLAESIGWNMYRQLFTEPGDSDVDFVFFISKEDDAAIDREAEEYDARMKSHYEEERNWILSYADYDGD